MLALAIICPLLWSTVYFTSTSVMLALPGVSIATVTKRTPLIPARKARDGTIVMKEQGPYTAVFTYVIDGREDTGLAYAKTDAEAEKLAVGSKLRIKSLHFAGLGRSEAMNDDMIDEAVVSSLVVATGLFLCGCLIHICFILPSQRRWLVKFGQPVFGRINAKTRRLPGERYKRLGFEYAVGSQNYSRTINVHRTVYDRFEWGQAVTVLHDPRNPQRGVAYELAEFGVLDSYGHLIG
jgi:hypothetical protein